MAGGSNRWNVDAGLLIVRVGIGAAFIAYGWPKLMAGAEMWEKVGQAVQSLGLTRPFFGVELKPEFWGCVASFVETVGGVMIVLGFLFRPFALLLFLEMAVATQWVVSQGSSFYPVQDQVTGFWKQLGWAHPAEMCVLFLALVFTGPGRVTLIELAKMSKKGGKGGGGGGGGGSK